MNTQGQTEDEVSPKTLLLYWTGPFFFFLIEYHLELWEMLGWVFCGKTIAMI